VDNIELIASFADLFGGVAVVFGICFAFLEFRRYKKAIEREAAATLARSFQTEDLAAAIRIVLELPEPIGADQYIELPAAEKNQIWLFFGCIESIGILVSRGDLSLELVDEFFSIPITEGWRKLAPYVDDSRRQLDSPQAWEWYQWLYERLCQRHELSPRRPAHVRPELR
jgi:hypothetical protein